jgi:hypothetical protein
VTSGGAAARASAGAASCMRLPRTFHPYVASGSSVTVHVGATVWAVEGEPDKYTSRPGFPWLSVQSSDARVLAPIRLCTTKVGSFGVPEHVYAFRATSAGSVTLSAPLAPSWRSATSRPPPYRGSVKVVA